MKVKLKLLNIVDVTRVKSETNGNLFTIFFKAEFQSLTCKFVSNLIFVQLFFSFSPSELLVLSTLFCFRNPRLINVDTDVVMNVFPLAYFN